MTASPSGSHQASRQPAMTAYSFHFMTKRPANFFRKFAAEPKSLGPIQASRLFHPIVEVSDQPPNDAPSRPLTDFDIPLRIDPDKAVLGDASRFQGFHLFVIDKLKQGLAGHLNEFHGVLRGKGRDGLFISSILP
jgi:hypothetical protein